MAARPYVRTNSQVSPKNGQLPQKCWEVFLGAVRDSS